ncbi:MAG: Type 1 glutamine amidotransferase-like domain-containing protein [Candidatus Paceibacterota bacterium]
MKILLTSSGLTNDSIARALSDLAGKSLSELNLLFIPTAANTEGGDKGWLINNLTDFQKFQFKSIDILDIAAVSSDIWKKRFEEKDIICFGGGNEKYLAEIFSHVGMKEYLLSSFGERVYMGISAGSMSAGNFISNELYREVFPEEDFGEITEKGMGLYDFCFIPHLNNSFFAHIRKENLEKVKGLFVKSVYSTDDETAIKINGDTIEIVGTGESWVYNASSL